MKEKTPSITQKSKISFLVQRAKTKKRRTRRLFFVLTEKTACLRPGYETDERCSLGIADSRRRGRMQRRRGNSGHRKAARSDNPEAVFKSFPRNHKRQVILIELPAFPFCQERWFNALNNPIINHFKLSIRAGIKEHHSFPHAPVTKNDTTI